MSNRWTSKNPYITNKVFFGTLSRCKKLPTSAGSSKKQESSRKTSISALSTMPKPLTMWITKKLWKILQDMGIPDHLTYLLRNLYADQEAIVRTGHGTTYWFQIGKGVRQGCILSPCLFNFYAEYIMRNTGLEESQVGIKIAGRNINFCFIDYAKVFDCVDHNKLWKIHSFTRPPDLPLEKPICKSGSNS